jgi:hypothetical protein
LKNIPEVSCSKRKATSAANSPVVQKRKTLSMEKNLKLPETKQQVLRADAEINVEKEATSAADFVPTDVNGEPTSTEQGTTMHVDPITIPGVQLIKGSTPLSTLPPKQAKQKKIVKLAKGTKEEQATKGVGFRHET